MKIVLDKKPELILLWQNGTVELVADYEFVGAKHYVRHPEGEPLYARQLFTFVCKCDDAFGPGPAIYREEADQGFR